MASASFSMGGMAPEEVQLEAEKKEKKLASAHKKKQEKAKKSAERDKEHREKNRAKIESQIKASTWRRRRTVDKGTRQREEKDRKAMLRSVQQHRTLIRRRRRRRTKNKLGLARNHFIKKHAFC